MLLFAVAIAVDLDRASLAVDAAGRQTQENLRKDAVKTDPWCKTTSFPQAGQTVDPKYAMYKKGCGLCASSCNPASLSVLAAANAADKFSISTINECYQKCKDNNCTAMSVDASTNMECTLHYTMPVGALCGDSSTTYHGCRVNPDNTNDAVASDRWASCEYQACFINEQSYLDDSTIAKLGHGTCMRDEGEMVVINSGQSDIVNGVAYTDGLTPNSVDCASSSSTSCWPPKSQLDKCIESCEGDAQCRAFNFGKRYRRETGTTVDYNTAAAEYFCQLLSTTPSYAGTDANDANNMGCHAYSSSTGGFSSVISITSKTECMVPYGPDCYVRTTHSTADYISRGDGFCQMDNGDEAIELSTMSPPQGQTWTEALCQAECTSNSQCVGLSTGTSTDSNRHTTQYCKLYKACDSSTNTCPSHASYSTQVEGQEITMSSKELLVASLCVDKCGGAVDAAGAITTAAGFNGNAGCSCLNQGPQGDGYRGPNGDAPWTDQSTYKFSCCSTDHPDCKTCMDSYTSSCFAKSTV